jgi:hypothetical protein
MEFRIMMVAALLIGVSLGTGAAFAHEATEFMEQGSQVSGPHTHGTVNDQNGFPDHEYKVDHVVWADADAPDTTEFTVHDTRYYDGTSAEPSKVKFGLTEFYTHGSNLISGLFDCLRVDGINRTGLTYWNYDDYEEDDIAVIEQKILRTANAAACSSSVHKVHTEAWFNNEH